MPGIKWPFSRFNRREETSTLYRANGGCYDVWITWTTYGIPHIKANDYESLAFGVGYCYARDNLALLVDAILTVRGVRSSLFGATEIVPYGSVSNLESDVFCRYYFDSQEYNILFETCSPFAAAMMQAYAKGVERYISDAGPDAVPEPYRAIYEANPIAPQDLYRLLDQKAVQTSGLTFAAAIVNARPPDSANEASSEAENRMRKQGTTSACLGSNAYALGGELTANGQGLLLGNPHFPWFGPYRFYQMHLMIPGELDVMGASLPPFPMINIGFNKYVSWSHTVSSSRRFAIYELTLAPEHHPLAYRVDGKIEMMESKTISVIIKGDDGKSNEVTRTIYSTRFGPVIVIPEMGCIWSKQIAYALYDVARINTDMIKQWLKINKAKSVYEIKDVLSSGRGALWLNTLAADRGGNVFFGDFSAVPNISKRMLRKFRPSFGARRLAEDENIAILNGSRSKSLPRPNRQTHDGRPLLPSKKMPSTINRDYVLNSNDSYWLTNKKRILSGYSWLIGRERSIQGLRTRMGHKEIAALMEQKGGAIGPDDLKRILLSNRNYAADLVLDQLDKLRDRGSSTVTVGECAIDLERAFGVLKNWDRCENIESRGAVLFREFWRLAQMNTGIWKKGFDPSEPLTTPRDLDIDNQEVAEFLKNALAQSVHALFEFELSLDVSIGEAQKFPIKNGFISISGGDGSAGVLNLIEFGPLGKEGYKPVWIQGTSYTQIVTWDGEQVVADAILPCSQSSNIDSPHYADQTDLFMLKSWVRLPFTEAEIENDPNSVTLRLTFSSDV